LLYFYSY